MSYVDNPNAKLDANENPRKLKVTHMLQVPAGGRVKRPARTLLVPSNRDIWSQIWGI